MSRIINRNELEEMLDELGVSEGQRISTLLEALEDARADTEIDDEEDAEEDDIDLDDED